MAVAVKNMNRMGHRRVANEPVRGDIEHRPLLDRPVASPLGRLLLAGEVRGGQGSAPRPLRVYGTHAVMLVLGGGGGYADARGERRDLAPGDLVTVFPDLGHRYGPPRGRRWDELYVTFDGPVWEAWRRACVLDPARPVARLADPAGWERRLRRLLDQARSPEAPPPMVTVGRFGALLAEALAAPDPDAQPGGWLARAQHRMLRSLADPVDLAEVAAEAGMSYETFRKRFRRATGLPPARWRTERRVETARGLLQVTPQMTNRQLAVALGFADEYHFSRRFKAVTGESPRDLRRAITRGPQAPDGGGEPNT